MNPLLLLALVSLASAAGAACRFLLDDAVSRRWRGAGPWGVWAVNTSGSLLLGVLAGAALGGAVPAEVVTVAGVGFLGSYTTFSTLCVQCVSLVRRGCGALAAGYLTASLLVGGLVTTAGVAAGSALVG